MEIRLMAGHVGSFKSMVVWWVLLIVVASGCKHGSSQVQLSGGTEENNGLFGQHARCEGIYRNAREHNQCDRLFNTVCDPNHTPPSACRASLVAPGVYTTTVQVLRAVLKGTPRVNATAQRISEHTRTMIANMMSDPQRPVHPVAFFAVIKDYETSSNLLEWGVSGFQCQSPGLCTKKCVDRQDCVRWCRRHGSVLGVTAERAEKECITSCEREGFYCDDRCLGLFQVDPELENFEVHSGSSPPTMTLRSEQDLRWDFQKICGDEGLNLLGTVGGPDFCALLFWLFESYGGERCHLFTTQRKADGTAVNPCKDPGYAWTPELFRRGHKVYGQQQEREDAWLRRYQGFMAADGTAVLGYEHCAAHSFHGYDYRAAKNLWIPAEALKTAVVDFACDIGMLPS